jgi:H+-transporting ATPase
MSFHEEMLKMIPLPDDNQKATTPVLVGLTAQEATNRLNQYGHNTIAAQKKNPALLFLKKFWGPVAWMLEITIGLQLYLGKVTEAIVIGALLLFNTP